MAEVPVEVERATPRPNLPDTWGSFRGGMDRLFDRFAGNFGFPSLRRMFDLEPPWRPMSSFSFSAPAIDFSEDDKSYNLTAEQPGLDIKDIDLTFSGDMLGLKGEKRQEKPPNRSRACRPACRGTARRSAV